MRSSLPSHQAPRRAVTLTELLVVLAIIGLLATLAVPMYLNHMELVKKNVALTECRQLAEAEMACALRHGFFVPLQLLDDIAPDPDRGATLEYDDLNNSDDQFTDLFLIDPFIRVDVQDGNQLELSQWQVGGTFNKRVADLYNLWGGPFMNVKRVWTGPDFKPDVPQVLDDDERAHDWPLDPWGNPYRLYSPLGVVGTLADSDLRNPTTYWNDLDADGFGDGDITLDGEYEFDRFAIVSYGPDGVEGTIQFNGIQAIEDARNDDIMYLFGMIPNDSSNRLLPRP